jgi:hypothetical protein
MATRGELVAMTAERYASATPHQRLVDLTCGIRADR